MKKMRVTENDLKKVKSKLSNAMQKISMLNYERDIAISDRKAALDVLYRQKHLP